MKQMNIDHPLRRVSLRRLFEDKLNSYGFHPERRVIQSVI